MTHLFTEADVVRITRLTDADIGRWVMYYDGSGFQRGRIKLFDNERQCAWVVYHCDNNWNTGVWVNYTAACTNYSDLQYAE